MLDGGHAAVALGGSGHGSESFRQKSKSPDDREGHRGERSQKGKADSARVRVSVIDQFLDGDGDEGGDQGFSGGGKDDG